MDKDIDKEMGQKLLNDLDRAIKCRDFIDKHEDLLLGLFGDYNLRFNPKIVEACDDLYNVIKKK